MFDRILKKIFSAKSKNDLDYPDLVKQALDSQLPVFSLWILIRTRFEKLKHKRLGSQRMLNGWINTSQMSQISKLENEVHKLRKKYSVDNDKNDSSVNDSDNKSENDPDPDVDISASYNDNDSETIKPKPRKPARNSREYLIVFVLILLFLFLVYSISRKSHEGYRTDELHDDNTETGLTDQTTDDFVFPESLLVFVKGGSFTMGCTAEQGEDCWDDEIPSQTVRVSDFFIAKHETTIGQFAEFVSESGYVTEAERIGGCHVFKNGLWELQYGLSWRDGAVTERRTDIKNKYPVVCVSWHDAMAYCDWLSEKTGYRFRLPTEAEWEYAARGGSSAVRTRFSGSNNIREVAWYNNNSSNQPQRVGRKNANELGIYDMSGNVWEWCGSHYQPYGHNFRTGQDHNITDGEMVLRGGSWFNVGRSARVSHRGYRPREYQSNTIGFRVVRAAD